MKKFLPFMLIKAVLTAALFGGIPGVKGIVRARADWTYHTVDDYSYTDWNLLYISKDEDLREEVYSPYNSDPASPAYTSYSPTYLAAVDSSIGETTTTHGGDITFTGKFWAISDGGAYDGYIDAAGGVMNINEKPFPRVFNITFISNVTPPDEPTEERILFFISENISRTYNINQLVDTSDYYLSSIQIYEDTRTKINYGDGIDWTEYENASPFPYFKDALTYTIARAPEFFFPDTVFITGEEDQTRFYNAESIMMTGRAIRIYSADKTATAGVTAAPAKDWNIFYTEPIEEDYITFIPTTTDGTIADSIAYINGTAAVLYGGQAIEELDFQNTILFNSTKLLWKIGSPPYGESAKLGPLSVTAVQNSAQAYNIFRYCCTAIIPEWEEPAPEPEPEPGEGIHTDWSTGAGVLAALIAAPITLIGGIIALAIAPFVPGDGSYGEKVQTLVIAVWNKVFDFLYPLFKSIGKITNSIIDGIEDFINDTLPRIQTFIGFIGKYWYLFLPAVIAVIIAINIANNRRR